MFVFPRSYYLRSELAAQLKREDRDLDLINNLMRDYVTVSRHELFSYRERHPRVGAALAVIWWPGEMIAARVLNPIGERVGACFSQLAIGFGWFTDVVTRRRTATEPGQGKGS
jgi:hypothetical protein